MRLSGNFSTLFAAMGSLFCWVFFPFLNIDIPISLLLNYSAALNTIYCISACVATTVSLTCIINGKLNFRLIIFSTIAGGVAVGSSAAIMNTSLQALLLGVGAAFVHVSLFQLEKLIRWYVVV
jgi:ammonium transporter Rh